MSGGVSRPRRCPPLTSGRRDQQLSPLPPFRQTIGLLGNDARTWSNSRRRPLFSAAQSLSAGNVRESSLKLAESARSWVHYSSGGGTGPASRAGVRQPRRIRERGTGVRGRGTQPLPARGRDPPSNDRLRRLARRDEILYRRHSHLAVPFPFPRRLVWISFLRIGSRRALPRSATDPRDRRHALGMVEAIRLHIRGVPRRGAASASCRLKAYQYVHGQAVQIQRFRPPRRTGGPINDALRPLYPEAVTALVHANPLQLARRDHPLGAVHRHAGEPRHARALHAIQDRPRLRRHATSRNWNSSSSRPGSTGTRRRTSAPAVRAIVERFGGEVPSTLDELVTLPGVGRKTANVVLGDAFDTPGITVDTHVGRLSRRLGLTRHTDPVKVEFALMELVPQAGVDDVQPPAHPARPPGVPSPASRGASRASLDELVPEGRGEEDQRHRRERKSVERREEDIDEQVRLRFFVRVLCVLLPVNTPCLIAPTLSSTASSATSASTPRRTRSRRPTRARRASSTSARCSATSSWRWASRTRRRTSTASSSPRPGERARRADHRVQRPRRYQPRERPARTSSRRSSATTPAATSCCRRTRRRSSASRENPELNALIGKTIITTDGTTLLGSDDKAGVAVIMEAARVLAENPEIPHGPVRVCSPATRRSARACCTSTRRRSARWSPTRSTARARARSRRRRSPPTWRWSRSPA